MHALIDQWRSCSFDVPPFIFPGDDRHFPDDRQAQFASHEEFIASAAFGQRQDQRFHLNLLPEPYCGNLEMAKVFLLSLNPGFGDGTYLGEQKPSRAALIRSIRQENQNDEFPFPHLNPVFADTGGYRYWTKKVNWVVLQIKAERKLSHIDALRFLAKNLATIELCPYHSRSFPANLRLRGIPSSDRVLAFVEKVLVPRATKGEIGLVVLRASGRWKLKPGANIVVNRGMAGRSSRLAPNDLPGQLLARHLCLRASMCEGGK